MWENCGGLVSLPVSGRNWKLHSWKATIHTGPVRLPHLKVEDFLVYLCYLNITLAIHMWPTGCTFDMLQITIFVNELWYRVGVLLSRALPYLSSCLPHPKNIWLHKYSSLSFGIDYYPLFSLELEELDKNSCNCVNDSDFKRSNKNVTFNSNVDNDLRFCPMWWSALKWNYHLN